MKWTKLLAVLILVPFWTGCEPIGSLYPFFEPQDKIMETSLLGEWSGGTDSTVKISFACQDLVAKECHLQLTTPNDDAGENDPQELRQVFKASLFHVGEILFLDLEPQGLELRWKDRTSVATNDGLGFYLPVHTVYRVNLEGDTLRLAYLDDDAVKGFADAQKLNDASLLGPGPLLIAPTRKLQNQLLAHAEDQKLLSDDIIFQRDELAKMR